MAKNLLTVQKLNNTKPTAKTQRLNDGLGLYLLVYPSGTKLWRFDYTFAQKRKTLSMGAFPSVSLAMARSKVDEARAVLAQNIDPSDMRKEAKNSGSEAIENARLLALGLPVKGSFAAIANEWGSKQFTDWEMPINKAKPRLERYIFPYVRGKKMCDLTAQDFLLCLTQIEAQGKFDTAKRVRSLCSQIYRYAISHGFCQTNVIDTLQDALVQPKGTQKKHFAAITEPETFGVLLRAIEGYAGGIVTKVTLQIAPMVFVRPTELRMMRWADLDFAAKEWRYFVTKTQQPHIVPLSRQVLGLIEVLRGLNGDCEWVFASETGNNKPISDTALIGVLRRLGYGSGDATVHGFRASARTMLDEVLGYPFHLIEHQLAHAVRDANGRSYNRTTHLKQRHEMMQVWADYLQALRLNESTTKFPKHRWGLTFDYTTKNF